VRTIGRIALVALVLVLSAGPALSAAALVTHEQPTVTAPRSSSAALSLLASALGGLAVFGAIKVKDAGATAAKWKAKASASGKDYEDGVRGAGADWEQRAREGAQNYRDAVVQAAGEGRFERGIAKAGAAKYTQRATTLGPQRYSTGVNAAEASFTQSIGPVLQTIASVQLPPRRPKGDPANMMRSQAVAQALRAAKVGR
jgi:hypothetical protein